MSMGLFQNLLKTYNVCEDVVGIVGRDFDGQENERKTLLPVFHTILSSQICVTLDGNGNLIDAKRDEKDTAIVIPCTEDSETRTSNDAAHPLCDQLDYLGGVDQNKYADYLKNLREWKDFASGKPRQKLEAVYEYVSKKSILYDLTAMGIFKSSELKEREGKIEPDWKKVRKIGVRFAVEIPGDPEWRVWKDEDLRQSWIDFTRAQWAIDGHYFDYLCGERVLQVVRKHPKSINPAATSAKIFSCNDFEEFTFRGRFDKKDKPIILDYEQSRKMHQALKWLISNYGYNYDTQYIIVWAIDRDTKPLMVPHLSSPNLFAYMGGRKTEVQLIEDAEGELYVDYARKLRNFLQGYGKKEYVTKQLRKISIAIFDATTKNTGRLSLTFYQELSEGKYLENIVNWHDDLAYYHTAWVEDKEGKRKKKIEYIGAPSYDNLVFAVYGRPRSKSDKSHQVIVKKMRKQLLECMFGNLRLPENIALMAAHRASNPMSFSDENNSFSPGDWNRAVSISCCLARKYYKQKYKEEIGMELENQRRDRDYLFGRLLAIADRLEQYALYKAGKDKERATNAVKLMSAFSIKPYSTWKVLYGLLNPFRVQLIGADYYQSLIDEVLTLFKPGEYEDNSPLSPLYLLGYSAQRRALTNYNKDGGEKDVEQQD